MTEKSMTEVVEIRGVKYTVTPEMAKALREEEKARQDEIAALKKAPEPPKPANNGAPPARVKFGDKIFEDPDGVLEEYGKELKKEVTETLRKEYQADKDRERAAQLLSSFYDEFFKENKELAEDRPYVELIFERNYANWNQKASGDLQQLKKMLAEEATKIILKHEREKPKGKENEDLVLEGGGELNIFHIEPPEKPKAKDDGPQSLSQVIKARRAARQQH